MTSDLDLPLLPSAEQIRRREFATVRRGYDLDQVRDYLRQVADQVETLEKALRDKRLDPSGRSSLSPGEALAAQMSSEHAVAPLAPTQMEAPERTPEEAYERLAKRMAAVLEAADHEAERLVTEAKADSTRIVEEARSEADRVRVDAQSRAEEARQAGTEALEEARIEADRILGGLADRRESLVTQMHEMQERLLSVAKDLEVAMDDRDEAIDAAVRRRADHGDTSTSSTSTPAAVTSADAAAAANDEPMDPRYEDLWATPNGGRSVDIPDLADIDVDFNANDEE